jgi:hypothetical protein
MRSISDVLHNTGSLTEYTCKNGNVLKIKYLDLKAMSEYENRLQNKAIKKLNEHKDIMDKAMFSDMFKELLDRISQGHYAFGNELCTATLKTIHGITDLLSILCSITPDEAADLILTEGEGLKQVFGHVLNKSYSSPDDEKSTVTTADGEKKS